MPVVPKSRIFVSISVKLILVNNSASYFSSDVKKALTCCIFCERLTYVMCEQVLCIVNFFFSSEK